MPDTPKARSSAATAAGRGSASAGLGQAGLLDGYQDYYGQAGAGGFSGERDPEGRPGRCRAGPGRGHGVVQGGGVDPADLIRRAT